MIFQFDQGSKVHIKNPSDRLGVVVLLPITRTSSKARANWKKILEILESSGVSSLVILDKTPNKEATYFFNESFKFDFINLYIVRRPPTEPIYDSQACISIDSRLWILQLHDDDEWNGSLVIPEDASEFDLFSTNFYFENRLDGKTIGWDESPPARINFTLVPNTVWNRFTEFIRAQGGHAAGSVDSTLNLVSRLICEHRQISTFNYYYDNRHWKNRRKASKNLTVLAEQDGWARLASVEIQLLNRNIDNLAALSFFRDLVPEKELALATSNLLLNFKPSVKRRILANTKNSCVNLLNALLRILQFLYRTPILIDAQNEVNSFLHLYRTIRKSWLIENNGDIIKMVKEWKDSGQYPILVKRFKFWEKFLR